MSSVSYDKNTRTRNFGEFCKKEISVPETLLTFVNIRSGTVTTHAGTRGTVTTCFTRTKHFCEVCTAPTQYPELLWVP